MDKNAPIGVFDSGVGGMTVAREIIRMMPEEHIVYFGDTARVPYGGKSKDTVIRYSRQILRFLMSKNVKAIVVACNTASAFALEVLRNEVNIPVLGVVKPGARVAVETTANGKIGVIGTEGTVKSGIYTEYIQELNANLQVFGKACPLFVPLVEEGMWHDPVTDEMVARYLEPIKEQGIDTLIMGCTHYPLIRSTIKKVIGNDVHLVNPAYETAVSLRRTLEWNELISDCGRPRDITEHEFYISDYPEKFQSFALSILKHEIQKPIQIDNIEEY